MEPSGCVFYVRYLVAELRRRPGRTALTALGLAVGVGLVVTGDGLGLGLSIAASVAQAHGGDLAIDPLDGGGLRVRVDLPTERM